MSNLSFRSRWGHLAHLEGNPRDQHHGTQSAHGSWDLLHSESFFTPNHHVGRGIASYLHSPPDSCVTLRWQRKDRAKNFISSYVMYTDAVEMYQRQSSWDYRTENNLKNSTIGSIKIQAKHKLQIGFPALASQTAQSAGTSRGIFEVMIRYINSCFASRWT